LAIWAVATPLHVDQSRAAAGARLCVLGAGNGNDFDLESLLAAHREVHLVDLDADAQAWCARRKSVQGRPGL
jgi:hypothetical protein